MEDKTENRGLTKEEKERIDKAEFTFEADESFLCTCNECGYHYHPEVARDICPECGGKMKIEKPKPGAVKGTLFLPMGNDKGKDLSKDDTD